MNFGQKAIIAIIATFAAGSICSGTENLTESQLMKLADRFSADSLSGYVLNGNLDVKWINGNSRYFWYASEFRKASSGASAGETTGRRYWLADTKTGKRTLIFDSDSLLSKVNALRNENDRLETIGIWELTFDRKNMSAVEFEAGRKRYRYHIRTGKTEESGDLARENYGMPADRKYYRSWSADSLYFINAKDDDIWLYRTDPETGEVADSSRLSDDGEHYYSFSYSGYGKNPAKGYSSVKGRWLCGSHCFLAFREDKRKVGTLSLINSLAEPRPSVETYKFPIPGDCNVPEFEAYVVQADSGIMSRLDIGKYRDQQLIVPRFLDFPTDDGCAWLLRISRTRDSLDLCRIESETKTVKTVIQEICPPHLNEQLFEYHIINGGKEILWWSERNGNGQWFLYDGDGKLKNSITDGKFTAGKIARIDTTGRYIIYEGYGGIEGVNPHYRFYYKASMDGNGSPVLLTPGNGTHEISFSPDGKLFLDKYSRMDMAPKYSIGNLKGKTVLDLEDCDISILKEKGWKEPEVAEFIAADSLTRLYGVVYLPFEIEEGKKYPVISNVYPGPQTDLVPQAFTIDDNYNQSLAQLGFIVVNVSYRGSCPVRGRDFYTYGYGNLRDYALDDDYAVLQQIGEKYPFADLGRVGIYGHSGGGFMAAAAMLTRPDFYKVCISASGNHDNNIYTQWWGETFHGVRLADDTSGGTCFECDIPTNMELAANLKGRMMLITGDMDNNVHPASTFRLAKALIDAGKRFDMLVIPGADHGLGDKYYINVIRYYFAEHLLGKKPEDVDILNHE